MAHVVGQKRVRFTKRPAPETRREIRSNLYALSRMTKYINTIYNIIPTKLLFFETTMGNFIRQTKKVVLSCQHDLRKRFTKYLSTVRY